MRNLIRKVIKEVSGAGLTGSYSGPLVMGPQIWDSKQLSPFNLPVYKYTNSELAYQEADEDFLQSSEKREKIEKKTKLISRINMEKKKSYKGQNDEDGSAINPTMSGEPLKEDLGVWFGTKKKPKGSKQPAGPWVNICRKKEGGGHPPCGRPEADSKSYPKCRAKGVAANMSDAQKRSACSQKRKAEKSNPKIGTGNKPTMVSNKKKSQNESLRDLISKILKESFK